MSLNYRCPVSSCTKECKSARGLIQHFNAFHRQQSPPSSPNKASGPTFTRWKHPTLTALPCDKSGNYLPSTSRPCPREPLDAMPENPFHPFEDRLAFEFADFHFSEQQSSEGNINRALELWAAQAAKNHGSDVPWASTRDMYATIDQIRQGSDPWKTILFCYQGPLPESPSRWMTQSYELVTRNMRTVLHEQIGCTDFDGHWDYTPFMEFNNAGDRVWTNIMSGDWAIKQAHEVSKDPSTHGAMLVGIIAGSDKTVASVATGHQEFHPFYVGPGNVDNPARRAHGIGFLPCAFLPIPKASEIQRQTPEFQRFSRQLYHSCLAYIYSPLWPAMTTPEVVQCPDGHFRRCIFSIGPYIADYPEQVWLACIVQNWCPKCDARPKNLDDICAHPRTHEKTDLLLDLFDEGVVWDEYGLRGDVVPFTHGFPRADIHQLITPDLLHQLIKGTFKDHLVTWIEDYLVLKHGKSHALRIIQDIDRRLSAVPPYPGLRRFADGRDFNQWTGDHSKALMKIYIAAIHGHVPGEMVRCLAAFTNCCYIVRRNAISTNDITLFQQHLINFHQHREIFITSGVRKSISLPRQHALIHYLNSIELFGSPNGTCSSQTEAKHIKAVKEPWRRSNRNKPLPQMLKTINRMDKLAAIRCIFRQRGMLNGSIVTHMTLQTAGKLPDVLPWNGTTADDSEDSDDDDDAIMDAGPARGPRTETIIRLAARCQFQYPTRLTALAIFINQPDFPFALRKFIHQQNHPDSSCSSPRDDSFNGPIHVFHSATIQFYAPSDFCGTGGMHREVLRANPLFGRTKRFDTVFVSVGNDNDRGMRGLLVARIWLFFSYFDPYPKKDIPCALVTWFIHPGDDPERDEDTGMWKVVPECDANGMRPVQVIHLNTIFRGAHLLPCCGEGFLPAELECDDALDAWDSYFVNHFIDNHTHELLA